MYIDEYFRIVVEQMLSEEKKYVNFGFNGTYEELFDCIRKLQSEYKDYRIIIEKTAWGGPPNHEFFMQMILKTDEDRIMDSQYGSGARPFNVV